MVGSSYGLGKPCTVLPISHVLRGLKEQARPNQAVFNAMLG